MDQGLAARIRSGDPRALARAATLVENRDPAAAGLLAALKEHEGHALVIGLTGPPGAGKSTLVDQLAAEFRSRGKTVAIVAVDPSSALTGGAILGDRVRMQRHHADDGVFIRSMATRGALGGVARATADMIRLLDAAGRDVVIVETVGVGQAEIDVARLASVTAVVLVPGMGDDVQAIKAGVLEIADVFVINKADRPGADKLAREIHEFSDRPIFQTVATEGTGIGELADALETTRGSRKLAHARTEMSIDHLGIAVRSIDAALAFYRDRLGLAVSARETVAHEKVHVAMLPVGEARIELLEASEIESTIAKFIDKRGEGIHHVALRVKDFRAAVERLRESGARLLNEPRKGAGGHTYVFVHPASTGGVLLELIEQEQE